MTDSESMRLATLATLQRIDPISDPIRSAALADLAALARCQGISDGDTDYDTDYDPWG